MSFLKLALLQITPGNSLNDNFIKGMNVCKETKR